MPEIPIIKQGVAVPVDAAARKHRFAFHPAFLLWLLLLLFSSTSPSSLYGLQVSANDDDAVPVVAPSIDSLIAAGELPAALARIQSLSADSADRYRRGIALEQIQAGNAGAAIATSVGIESSERRSETLEELGRQVASDFTGDIYGSDSQGGITANDFQPLIDLVQSVIGASTWRDAGGEGAISAYPAGVYVDAKQCLRPLAPAPEKTLDWMAIEQRMHAASSDGVPNGIAAGVQRESDLRVVSLNRLEAAMEANYATGRPMASALQTMAGLYRIDFLMVDQEHGDVLIAGPAGAWRADGDGRTVHAASGRPTLWLDDWIVCLHNAKAADGVFGCSIDPDPASLKLVKAQLEKPMPSSRRGQQKWATDLRAAMGEQNVSVFGIPASSHLAKVLIEADLKMKMIGMGTLPSIDAVPSYLDRVASAAQPAASKQSPLIRWWFTPDYAQLLHDHNNRMFAWGGNRVRVLSENEFLDQQARRTHTGTSDSATAGFAGDFTDHFEAIADRHAVFWQLRNAFDLAMAANLMKQHRLAKAVSWNHETFANASNVSSETVSSMTDSTETDFDSSNLAATLGIESQNVRFGYRSPSYEVATKVPSIMNLRQYGFTNRGKRYRGQIVGISGGVTFSFRETIVDLDRREVGQTAFPEMLAGDAVGWAVNAQGQSHQQWWWDADQPQD